MTTFSTPFRQQGFLFYTGSFSAENILPHTISLDGRTYAIDLADYRHASVETLRDQVVTSSEPSDLLFSADGVWSRYRISWHQGAGQTQDDLADDALPFRYLSSTQINVWTRNQLTLHRATSRTRTVSTATPVSCVSSSYVFVADGNNLYRSTDMVSWTTITTTGIGTIQALASDGQDLYVATTTQLVKVVGAATTTSQFSNHVTGNIANVAFVGDRLLISKDNALEEVGSNGNTANIETHWQSAFRWTTIFEVGSRIYAGGFAGSFSELYGFVVDSGGALVRGPDAASFATGELLRTAISIAGVVVLCSNRGVRFAQTGGDGTLTYGPVITAPGDVRCADSENNVVYTGWSNYASGRAGLASFDLSRFVGTLQPAYSADLSAVATGNVMGVARLAGKTGFLVANDGFYVEQATFETTGTIRSGRLYFGTVEEKRVVDLDVSFAALTVGQSVQARVLDIDGSLVKEATMANVGQRHLRIDLDSVPLHAAQVELILTGNGTSTPTVRDWALRGYPIPPSAEQWIVPILAFSRVRLGDGMGQEMTYDNVDVMSHIRELWQSKRRIQLAFGDYVTRVRVDAFELRPTNWRDNGGWFEGVLVVKLISAQED